MYRSAANAARIVPCWFCGQHAPTGEKCGRCSVPLPDPSADPPVRDGCPRCGGTLDSIDVDAAAAVHACKSCGGIFAPARAWCFFAEHPEAAAAVIAALPPPSIPRHVLLGFLRCSGCGSHMERGRFATTEVVVDVCALHGIWLEACDLDFLVKTTSDPERRRQVDKLMEAVEREQRVAYAIASESDRIRGDSFRRLYGWKVASIAIGLLLVLARVTIGFVRARH